MVLAYPRRRPGTLLLHPLGDPAAVGLARKHDPHPLVTADGHQMRPVLLDARPVVHQHELERIPVERRSLTTERLPRRLVEQLPVPAPISRPGLLESPIRPSNISTEVLTSIPPPSSDEPENEKHSGKNRDNDQNNRKHRHGPESMSARL